MVALFCLVFVLMLTNDLVIWLIGCCFGLWLSYALILVILVVLCFKGLWCWIGLFV